MTAFCRPCFSFSAGYFKKKNALNSAGVTWNKLGGNKLWHFEECVKLCPLSSSSSTVLLHLRAFCRQMDRFHNALFMGLSAGVPAVSRSRLTCSLANGPTDKTRDSRSDKHHAEKSQRTRFAYLPHFTSFCSLGTEKSLHKLAVKGFSFELRIIQQSSKSRLLEERTHTHMFICCTWPWKTPLDINVSACTQRGWLRERWHAMSPSHTTCLVRARTYSDFFFFPVATLSFLHFDLFIGCQARLSLAHGCLLRSA